MNNMVRIVATDAAVPALRERSASFKARFTSAEFQRMLDCDAFGDWHVELIEGELQRMPPPGNKHGLVQIRLLSRLLRLLAEDLVRAEQAIDLGNDTVVGFDAALLRAALSADGVLEPADLSLVIEVADTTLRRDTQEKRLAYAAAAVPVYWVVDTKNTVVRVHAQPIDGEYTDVRTVRFGEPLAVPGTDATITLD